MLCMQPYSALTQCGPAISLVCSRNTSVQLVAAQEAANSFHRMMATLSGANPRHGVGSAELWNCHLTHIEAACRITQRGQAQQLQNLQAIFMHGLEGP